jgi:YVTN family beta-propeller protein
MKINFKSSLLFALAVSYSLVSCNKSSDPVKGKYQTGVLVANEGGFGAANGDVTYYNASSDLLDQTIFKNANGTFAGDVLQSITIDGDNGYLVLNGSNTIEIVDDYTFKSKSTFTDKLLDKPRYLQVINGKAYISVWGPFNSNFSLTSSYVLVVDVKTLQVTTSIATDPGVENLLYNGKYLFASNYNFGGSNTVSVIDPSTNTLVKKITLAAGPAGMVLDANNKLWVITSGSSTNFIGNNDGKLIRINPSTFDIEQTIELNANPLTDLGVSPDKKSLYYAVNSSVYKIDITASSAPSTAWSNTTLSSLYALGVDPKTGEVYLGDALNFSSEGKVFIYNTDGTFKTFISAGISPGQFIFR